MFGKVDRKICILSIYLPRADMYLVITILVLNNYSLHQNKIEIKNTVRSIIEIIQVYKFKYCNVELQVQWEDFKRKNPK